MKRQTVILVSGLVVVTLLVFALFTLFYTNRIDLAVTYLKSHFNGQVGLLYESEGTDKRTIGKTNYYYNHTYCIYSDNFIGMWSLKPYEPQMSKRINETIQSYNLQRSMFFEVLFGTPIPTNVSIAVHLVLAQYPDKVIMAEFHNASEPLLWDQYGDTLLYQSLNLYLRGNRKGAEYYFFQAYQLYDGQGIYDLATEKEGTYANYKLALLLYVSKVLNLPIKAYQEIEALLWEKQQTNGGITSLSDLNGNPIGSANTETTAMTLFLYNHELISWLQSRLEN